MTAKDYIQAHKRINAARVCELCGGVSDMSLYRWLNTPSLNFPKPIYITGRRYWREADVVEWLEAQERDESPARLREEAAALLSRANTLESEWDAA